MEWDGGGVKGFPKAKFAQRPQTYSMNPVMLIVTQVLQSSCRQSQRQTERQISIRVVLLHY